MSDDATRHARAVVARSLALWDRLSVAWDSMLEQEQIELVERAEAIARANEAVIPAAELREPYA